MQKPFWQHKPLLEMTHEEWESLCDGCGKCCLTQLQDDENDTLVFTNVACDLLNDKTCRCKDYPNRTERVPDCMTMTADNVKDCAEFAPSTCAYRLLLEGKPLPEWHHLRSGDSNLIHEIGKSVQGKVQFRSNIADEEYENYIVDWC